MSQLRRRPGLTYTWIRYLQCHIPDGFFKPVYTSLISALQKTPVIFSSDGILCRPDQVLIPPPRFRNRDDASPLVASKYLGSKYYISAAYDASRDASVLTELGVKMLSATEFLDGLRAMQRDGSLIVQTDQWWETVSETLHSLFREGYRDKIRSLNVVPLANGSWTFAAHGDLFFNSALADIPQDLGLQLVKELDVSSSQYRLLQDLGVKEASPTKVAELIAVFHWRTPVRQLAQADLSSHVRFLFRHWSQLERRTFNRIWVLTDANVVLSPTEVYMDYPTHTSFILRRCLRGPNAHFLHPSYDNLPWSSSKDENLAWRDWLHLELGIHIAPRLGDGGLSQEFRDFARQADTVELLLFLREYFEDMAQQVIAHDAARQELRDLQVTTSHGAKHSLHSTFLPRGHLSQFRDLPFLPINDPDDNRWDFLGTLGVSFQVDGTLFLKELVRLSETRLAPASLFDETLAKARVLYKQLEVRFEVEGLADVVR